MWTLHKTKLRRIFTVKSMDNNEMFILTLEDLETMRSEYKDFYNEIFKNGMIRLQKLNAVQEDAQNKCAKQQASWIEETLSQKEKKSLIYDIKFTELHTLDKMRFCELLKTIDIEPSNNLHKLIKKYLYLEVGCDLHDH